MADQNSKFLIIANPISGKGKAIEIAERALKRLSASDLDADLKLTTQRGDAQQISKIAIDHGVKTLIACGGDGTVHEIVNAIAGRSEITLGLIPCGKGNDLANALEIPRNPDSAVDLIIAGKTRQIDLGKVGDRFFGTILTCGFDAEVGRRVTEEGSFFKGTLAYVQKAISTLFRYTPPHARIEGDFGVHEGEILLTSIGNTSSYGGGMKIVPNAVMDDGFFDVCIIVPVPKLTILRMLVTLFWGGHTRHPAVQIHRTRSLKISTQPPLDLYADGEFVGSLPTEIEILPKKLNVIAPAK